MRQWVPGDPGLIAAKFDDQGKLCKKHVTESWVSFASHHCKHESRSGEDIGLILRSFGEVIHCRSIRQGSVDQFP